MWYSGAGIKMGVLVANTLKSYVLVASILPWLVHSADCMSYIIICPLTACDFIMIIDAFSLLLTFTIIHHNISILDIVTEVLAYITHLWKMWSGVYLPRVDARFNQVFFGGQVFHQIFVTHLVFILAGSYYFSDSFSITIMMSPLVLKKREILLDIHNAT